jgi:uncharacterized membrane protein YphA (DoxX/SURF4 family)
VIREPHRTVYPACRAPCSRPRKEKNLFARFYSGFPGGLPGAALAILRGVIGIAMLVQGGMWLAQPESAPGAWVSAVLAICAGCLVLVGFLTPIATAITLVYLAAIGASLLPAPQPNLFDSKMSVIFGLTILLSVAGLGPGAFSVDARAFGRREIVLPPEE